MVLAGMYILPILNLEEGEILESEPNNSATQAQIVKSGETVVGSVDEHTDGLDYFKVDVDNGVALTGNLSSLDGSDFDLFLYDSVSSSATEIAISNYFGTSDEQISIMTTKSGSYFFAVKAYKGSADYKLQIDIRTEVVSVDNNDVIGQAETIGNNRPVQSTASKYMDQDDYYKIAANSNQYLIATLTVPNKCDFDLYIYDETGTGGGDWFNAGDGFNEGASANVWGGESLNIAIRDAGTWYINVHAYRGSGMYTLTVQVRNALAADDSDGEDIANAEDLTAQLLANPASPLTIEKTLDRFNDANDYYSVDLDSGYTLTLKMEVPSKADFDMYVYDSSGTGANDFVFLANDTTPMEVLYISVTQAETYYINPYSYSGSGQYNLTLLLSGGSGWPIASAGLDLPNEKIGLPVQFDGVGSIDDVGIISYEWDFGDDTTGSGATPTHTYSTRGTYEVTLTTTDADAHSTTDSMFVNVLSGQKYAVVVGVSDYMPAAEAGGLKDLNYADDDAEDWKDYLEDQGYTVTMLLDHEATLSNILAAINAMKELEGPGDHVAFTFSGHGGTWREGGYLDFGDHSMVFPADADGRGGNGLLDTDLQTLFADFDSDHMFFFYDSCRSGGMDETAGPGRMILQASAANEVALDAGRYKNGLWTYWFLEWGLLKQRHGDVESAFAASQPQAVSVAAEWETSMHPEMQDGDSSYFML